MQEGRESQGSIATAGRIWKVGRPDASDQPIAGLGGRLTAGAQQGRQMRDAYKQSVDQVEMKSREMVPLMSVRKGRVPQGTMGGRRNLKLFINSPPREDCIWREVLKDAPSQLNRAEPS